ncbi:MAG: MbcA/ParS/Xre antitoxin family protein [Planctomycetaceae bacterium]|nr:MbcA/ParS/Xre antitoxin family protein [Planctomycetaceae bacterium]
MKDRGREPRATMALEYENFEDLPEWVKDVVSVIRADDVREWVFKPVPALCGKSIMTLMNNGEEGQQQVRDYVNAVKGKFF